MIGPPNLATALLVDKKSRLITIPKDKRVVDVVANANTTFDGWGYDRLIALRKTPTFLALLSPKGDQNQFYPNNIWYVSHIRKKVIRINKIMTKRKILWSFIRFSQLILQGNVKRSVLRICEWIMWLEGEDYWRDMVRKFSGTTQWMTIKIRIL